MRFTCADLNGKIAFFQMSSPVSLLSTITWNKSLVPRRMDYRSALNVLIKFKAVPKAANSKNFIKLPNPVKLPGAFKQNSYL